MTRATLGQSKETSMIPEIQLIIGIITIPVVIFLFVLRGREVVNVIRSWRQSRATPTEEAKKLLVKAAKGDGVILQVETSGPLTEIQASGQVLAKTKDARLASKWKAAVEELVEVGYIIEWSRGKGWRTFQVTHKGHEFVKNL